MFTSTEDATVYQLPDTGLKSVSKVEVMNNQGEWITKVLNTDYTRNLTKGTVTFNSPIGLPPVDGRDNVRIKYEMAKATR